MKMNKDIFYVMAFNSTSHSIQTFKYAKEKFKVVTMPTPREITNDCGLAIKFPEGNLEEIMEFFSSLTVPCDLYSMSVAKINGKRITEKIATKGLKE